MKHWKLFISAVILLSVLVTEIVLNLKEPYASPKEDSQFKYQYNDIGRPFFKKTIIEGKCWYKSGRAGGNTQKFSCSKAAKTMRIFIVGGSVAYNFNHLKFSDVLKEINPEYSFEVINCGMGAYDIYRDMLVCREIVKYNPDLVVLFSGNNEFYNGDFIPWKYKINKFMRRSWLYRSLQRYVEHRKPATVRTPEYINSHFARHLSSLSGILRSRKIPLIICTLPVNLRNGQSSVNFFPDEEYVRGSLLLEMGKFNEARIQLNKSKLPPRSWIYMLLGQCYDNLGEFDKAKLCYSAAADYDPTLSRTNPSRNILIREVPCDKLVQVADIEKAFWPISRNGIPGKEQFYDICHWYDMLNPIAARCIIGAWERMDIFQKFLRPGADIEQLLPYKQESFYELGKVPGMIKSLIYQFLWDACQNQNQVSMSALYALDNIWKMDRAEFYKLDNYNAGKIRKIFSEVFWTCDLSLEFISQGLPSIELNLGEFYRINKCLEMARKYFESAKKSNDTLTWSYIGEALIYLQKADHKGALAVLDGAQKAADKDLILLYKSVISGFKEKELIAKDTCLLDR